MDISAGIDTDDRRCGPDLFARHELPRDREIVLMCKSGARSARATEFLMKQGFTSVFNLEGGIAAWASEIDREMTRY